MQIRKYKFSRSSTLYVFAPESFVSEISSSLKKCCHSGIIFEVPTVKLYSFTYIQKLSSKYKKHKIWNSAVRSLCDIFIYLYKSNT